MEKGCKTQKREYYRKLLPKSESMVIIVIVEMAKLVQDLGITGEPQVQRDAFPMLLMK